jgi:hypothetical protein
MDGDNEVIEDEDEEEKKRYYENVIKEILNPDIIKESAEENNITIGIYNLISELKKAYQQECPDSERKHNFFVIFTYEPLEILKISQLFYFSKKYNVALSLLRNSLEGFLQAAFLDFIFSSIYFNIKENLKEIKKMIYNFKRSTKAYKRNFVLKIDKLLRNNYETDADVFFKFMELTLEANFDIDIPNVMDDDILKYIRSFGLLKPIDIIKKNKNIKDLVRYDVLSMASHENVLLSDTMLNILSEEELERLYKENYILRSEEAANLMIIVMLNIIKDEMTENTKKKEKIKSIYKEYKELFEEKELNEAKIKMRDFF